MIKESESSGYRRACLRTPPSSLKEEDCNHQSHYHCDDHEKEEKRRERVEWAVDSRCSRLRKLDEEPVLFTLGVLNGDIDEWRVRLAEVLRNPCASGVACFAQEVPRKCVWGASSRSLRD